MGADYYSYAVIGCELPINKLYKTVTESHTKHDVPSGAKFCPVCGELATIKDTVSIFGEGDEQIGQFKVVWSTDRKRAFVGLVCDGGSYYREMERVEVDDDLSKLKLQLRDTLLPFGLWDESSFGLYTVLHCSY